MLLFPPTIPTVYMLCKSAEDEIERLWTDGNQLRRGFALSPLANIFARHLARRFSSRTMVSKSKSRGPPAEHTLVLPRHEALKSDSPVELVDSHTHVLSTYLSYIKSYPDRTHESIQAFVKALLASQDSNKVAAVVDVWCEAPLVANWREIVDSLTELKSEGLSYHFVVGEQEARFVTSEIRAQLVSAGAHPHEAKLYTDQLEQEFQAAHRHPLCVGWGEIGLVSLSSLSSLERLTLTTRMLKDYHYDNSPREIQQDVLRRQLRASLASGLGKAITIHTREADDDIYRILTEELRESREVVKLHIHCFTDSPELAEKILAFFPNAYIGITGVITYSSNVNTSSESKAHASRPCRSVR